jgi:arylsulfatase A-like enzyme
MPPTRPDILFIMTDQQRFDTIAALGNPHTYSPNLDRLVRRGISFPNAYATCPVCVAARYTIRTGCEPATTRVFSNAKANPVAGQALEMEARCGPSLGRAMSQLGYRTFGIGKFHTRPWNEDVGYERLWRSEETYHPDKRLGDDYASWLARERPAFDFLEQPLGERTEMYHLPQRSPLPAELGVEWWLLAARYRRLQSQIRRGLFLDLYRLSVRIHRSLLQFRSIGCTIPIECRTSFSAAWRKITWMKRSPLCVMPFGRMQSTRRWREL